MTSGPELQGGWKAVAFTELENAWEKGRQMESPVLASLSLGHLYDIRGVGGDVRQAAQVWVAAFSRPMTFVALGLREMPKGRGQTWAARPSLVREGRQPAKQGDQGGCSRTRKRLQGQGSEKPWETWPGKPRQGPWIMVAMRERKVPGPLPNGSSTLDSSVAGEGSPGLDPESPRETGVGRTSQDTLLFWWKRETPIQVDPKRAKRGPLGSGSWRPMWEGRGGRGWEHEGGCALGSGVRRGQSDTAGVGPRAERLVGAS